MNTKTNDIAPTLEETIERAFASLENDDPTTDDYEKVVDQLTKLYKMKEIEYAYEIKTRELDAANDQKAAENDLKQQELNNFDRLSKAQLATILANLAGIAVIMTHERTHIIVTKALGFVSKLK